MRPEPVTVRRREHDGTTSERKEDGGGVFHPLPEKGVVTPIWVYGPEKQKRVLFSCPVSALPPEVFDLYRLWIECRLAKVLPLAGGWLDQPEIVRRAFTAFNDEARVFNSAAVTED